jgi:poly(3-hydroxybutyrate) depolymerase
VMGWVNKPPGFKEGQEKKWPLAFLIHGGPQGAWEDSWSTRWNQAMFAAKGYITVAVNPTGSTGYGQEFTDRIQGNWGSRKSTPPPPIRETDLVGPYKDLVAGYHAALKLFPEVSIPSQISLIPDRSREDNSPGSFIRRVHDQLAQRP